MPKRERRIEFVPALAAALFLASCAPKAGGLAKRGRAPVAPPDPADRELAAASREYGARPREAEAKLNAFVKARQGDKSPRAQDDVARARMELGYLAAKRGSFAAARTTFLTASTSYKGSGTVDAAYGSLPDQAAYQAAVCLLAEGKKGEAEREFVRFIRERPTSPLADAAFKRLQRLNGGDAKPEQRALFEAGVQKREAAERRESAMCGPKTIAYLLESGGLLTPKRFKRPSEGLDAQRTALADGGRPSPSPDGVEPIPSYEAIAKLCGTTDAGTSIAGMRKGLSALGVFSYPAEVNSLDFRHLPTPFIWLAGNHYLAVLSFGPQGLTTQGGQPRLTSGGAEVYDSFNGAKESIRLPASDDPDFKATVITFSPPDFKDIAGDHA